MRPPLRVQQRVVLRGVAVGVVAQVAILAGAYQALDPPAGVDALDSRLALALRCSVFPALTLLLGVGAVGNSRFLSEAIDPFSGRQSERMDVYGRYLQNTLEQLVLFEVALAGLALYLEAPVLRLLPALSINFTLGRVVFLVGYLRHPLYRAPGFAMTLYPTLIALVWLAWRVAGEAL